MHLKIRVGTRIDRETMSKNGYFSVVLRGYLLEKWDYLKPRHVPLLSLVFCTSFSAQTLI